MSKRYITNGLIVIIYLFIIMYPQITVKAYYQNDNCNHTNWVYHTEISPYIDDDNEIIDGRIAYYYCADCGRYAKDVGFTNLMSADEIIDYYVYDEVVLELGGDSLKSSDIMLTPMGFERVSYDGINFSKYKYISSHSTTGKLIKTTKDTKLYKNTLKSITIKVITKCADPNKKVKYVKVRFELPKPKVKIKKKWNSGRCTYTFMYNVKGASKIKVRMFNGKTYKAINNSEANKIFDKYMAKPKSDKESYIWFSKEYLKKYNNYIGFKVTAYYGKNKVSTWLRK